MPKGTRQNQLARSLCHVGAFDTQIKLLECIYCVRLLVCLFVCFSTTFQLFRRTRAETLATQATIENFLLKHYVKSNYLLCLR